MSPRRTWSPRSSSVFAEIDASGPWSSKATSAAGPTNLLSGTSSMLWPPRMKWLGASTWVPLWQNMSSANEGQSPPEFLSTHPSSDTRIDQLVGQFGKTLALYNEAQAAGRRPNCTAPASN